MIRPLNRKANYARLNSATILTMSDVSKHYAGKKVVNNINLSIQKGEIVGFLGLNGAGKSTTLGIICGAIAPTTGQVIINGNSLVDNPKAAKQSVGYVADPPALHDDSKVIDFLTHVGRLYGLKGQQLREHTAQVIDECSIKEICHHAIAHLSHGYRQRVALAQALIHKPDLLVLDEPSNGLDPVQIQQFCSLLNKIKVNCGVILSTHNLLEVGSICDRVLILRQGRITQEHHFEKNQANIFCAEFSESFTPTEFPQLSQYSISVQNPLQWQVVLNHPEQAPEFIKDCVSMNLPLKQFSPQTSQTELLIQALNTVDTL